MVSAPSLASSILVATCFLANVSAFWRMPCASRLVQERVDPIVSPGKISGHVHTVAGGSGFGFTMDYNQARASKCSSCPIKQDMSAYWVPKLYFRAQNGSFIGVKQSGDYGGRTGGPTVYYLQRRGPNNDRLKAFPPGFRMLAGDPFKRKYTGDYAAQGISYTCLDYDHGSHEYNAFPPKNCPQGLRQQVFFPSCWDGKNLDSADHKSHVSYPASGAYNSGPCPASHPVHLMSLFYEFVWDTNEFANQWHGNTQPFVLAQGDPTGYGGHGDFVNGWDIDTLQKAADNCNNDSGVMEECPYFDFYNDDEQQSCKVPVVLKSNIDGPRPLLPGCNPVSSGPATVIPPKTCDRVPKIGMPKAGYTDMTSQKYKYIGCGSDNVGSRTFNGASSFTDSMTVGSCVAFCKGKGFTYAGLEYASQCFCGNSLASDRAPKFGIGGNCNMPCKGSSQQICGGAAALSIYQACGNSACKNPAAGSLPGGLPTA